MLCLSYGNILGSWMLWLEEQMHKDYISLDKVSDGMEVIFVSVDNGLHIKGRLSDMGFYKGIRFKVLNSHGRNGCIVVVGNTRLVIGRGMAHKILVCPVGVKEDEKN